MTLPNNLQDVVNRVTAGVEVPAWELHLLAQYLGDGGSNG